MASCRPEQSVSGFHRPWTRHRSLRHPAATGRRWSFRPGKKSAPDHSQGESSFVVAPRPSPAASKYQDGSHPSDPTCRLSNCRQTKAWPDHPMISAKRYDDSGEAEKSTRPILRSVQTDPTVISELYRLVSHLPIDLYTLRSCSDEEDARSNFAVPICTV